MKLALIQTKQNELYNFPGTRTFDTEEVLRLRHEYMEEVFRMTEEAAKEGADLIVTTEVVNYSGHFSKIKVPDAVRKFPEGWAFPIQNDPAKNQESLLYVIRFPSRRKSEAPSVLPFPV